MVDGPNTADVNRRNRAARRWQWLTVPAGLMLAVSFFMSWTSLRFQIFWASGADSPCAGWTQVFGSWHERDHTLSDVVELIWIFALSALPHLWGFTMALYSVGCLATMRRVTMCAHICGAALGFAYAFGALVACASLLPALVTGIGKGGFAGAMAQTYLVFVGFFLVVILVGLVYGFLALRRRPWAYLYHGFLAAALVVFLPGFTILSSGSSYQKLGGLTLSMAGGCLLLICRVGEARAVTGLSWRRTILYLLTLRLRKAARPVGHCPGCGYNLYGLREMRCPECGRAFTFEEVNATPDAIGFAADRAGAA